VVFVLPTLLKFSICVGRIILFPLVQECTLPSPNAIPFFVLFYDSPIRPGKKWLSLAVYDAMAWRTHELLKRMIRRAKETSAKEGASYTRKLSREQPKI